VLGCTDKEIRKLGKMMTKAVIMGSMEIGRRYARDIRDGPNEVAHEIVSNKMMRFEEEAVEQERERQRQQKQEREQEQEARIDLKEEAESHRDDDSDDDFAPKGVMKMPNSKCTRDLQRKSKRKLKRKLNWEMELESESQAELNEEIKKK
jgi:hypothetical protein